MIQLAAMPPIVGQFTAENPAAAMPAPITPPTMECVVDTGAPRNVAKLTQSADEISAAIIAQMKTSWPATLSGLMIPLEMVETTSPPAKSAPAVSHTAAIAIAPPMVSALAPTAGPMLLATSFAPMFTAIYAPTPAAAITTQDVVAPAKNMDDAMAARMMKRNAMPRPTIGLAT